MVSRLIRFLWYIQMYIEYFHRNPRIRRSNMNGILDRYQSTWTCTRQSNKHAKWRRFKMQIKASVCCFEWAVDKNFGNDWRLFKPLGLCLIGATFQLKKQTNPHYIFVVIDSKEFNHEDLFNRSQKISIDWVRPESTKKQPSNIQYASGSLHLLACMVHKSSCNVRFPCGKWYRRLYEFRFHANSCHCYYYNSCEFGLYKW